MRRATDSGDQVPRIHRVSDRPTPEFIVAHVEELLEEVRDGAVVGLVFATLTGDGRCHASYSAHPDTPVVSLIGAAELLRAHVADMVEDETGGES